MQTVLDLVTTPAAPLPSADRAAVLKLLLRDSATADAAWMHVYSRWKLLSESIE